LSLLQQCVLEGFKKKSLYGNSNDPIGRKKNMVAFLILESLWRKSKKTKKSVITKRFFRVVTKGNQVFLVKKSLISPKQTPGGYVFSYSNLLLEFKKS
jgi:hypothetical protein